MRAFAFLLLLFFSSCRAPISPKEEVCWRSLFEPAVEDLLEKQWTLEELRTGPTLCLEKKEFPRNISTGVDGFFLVDKHRAVRGAFAPETSLAMVRLQPFSLKEVSARALEIQDEHTDALQELSKEKDFVPSSEAQEELLRLVFLKRLGRELSVEKAAKELFSTQDK